MCLNTAVFEMGCNITDALQSIMQPRVGQSMNTGHFIK
ncbi:hypothetical protein CSB66_4896 [Enterobacter hormaechei]|nr:hypothetical protein CSB66_4896 [Enterobacter hormaechei]